MLATPEPAIPPRVWLLVGDKLGDNSQAFALADALGWPYEVRQVFPKPEWVLGKPHFEPGLHHLDPERSARLEPPWPDLLLTIGRRPSMAAPTSGRRITPPPFPQTTMRPPSASRFRTSPAGPVRT